VAARLTLSVEALAEHLSLLLHALETLPPAGILPVPSLAAGLLELASTFQGHVVSHLLSDTAPDAPGLPAAIRRLRALDAADDRSVEADIVWARGQLHEVRAMGTRTQTDAPAAPARRGILRGLLRRGAAPGRATPASRREAWIAAAEQDWQATIVSLQSIHD
jgi:hypothetical protein